MRRSARGGQLVPCYSWEQTKINTQKQIPRLDRSAHHNLRQWLGINKNVHPNILLRMRLDTEEHLVMKQKDQGESAFAARRPKGRREQQRQGSQQLQVLIIKKTLCANLNTYGKVTAEQESLIKNQLLEQLDKIIFSASSSNS